jgi:predicted dehydrogenase
MTEVKKLRTGIIGLGPHGKRILEAAGQISELNIIALIDGKLDVLQDLSLANELLFTDLDLALSECNLEVLLIATNGPSHFTIACKAMDAGVRYVMVEKPMACSLSECMEMEALAKKKGVRLSVDKVNRHDPVFQMLRENIANSTWGQLRSIYIQKPGIGLGCLGTHSFDLCNFLVGSDAISVTGWVDEPVGRNPRGEQFVDPGGLVIIRYPNNVRAIVEQIEDGAGPQTMEIHLTGAKIYHDPKNKILDIRVRDLSVKPGPGRPQVYSLFNLSDDLNVKGDMIFQIRSVIRELIGIEDMLTDAKFGRKAMEILVAAYSSNSNGNIPITMPLTNESDIEFYLQIT